MSRPLRSVALALALLSGAQAVPMPAEAQLGGLTRRAREAVEKKADEKVEEKIEEVMPYTPPPAPVFDDRVLEITPDVLTRLLRGFDAEIEFADRAGEEYQARARAHEEAVRTWERALEGYEERRVSYDACVADFEVREEETRAEIEERFNKPLEEMDDEEFEEYIEDLARRGEIIAHEVQAGKSDPETRRRHEAYQVEVNRMQVEQSRRMSEVMSAMADESERAATEDPRLKEACGGAPERPVEPLSELTSPEGVLSARGAEVAALTPAQYSVMRERVVYWARKNGRPSGMGFSEREMGTLSEAKGDVEEILERMRRAKVPV